WPLLTQALAGHGAMLMTSGRPTAGLGLLRVALEVAREHDLPSAQLVPLNNLASFLAARDVTAARTYVEEGLALARILGDEDTGSYLRGTAAFIYWQCGEWDALRLVVAGQPQGSDFAIVAAMYDALAKRARGETLAEPAIEADDALAPQLAAAQWSIVALQELEAGDPVAATAAAARALQTFARFGGFDDDFPTYWCSALDLSLDHGPVDEARAIFTSVADAPRGQLSPLVRALIPYFRARLVAADGGDAALVAADFATGAADLAAFGAPYWQARCQLDHAGWLTEHGRRDEAVSLVDEADRLFTALRAQPWLERTRRMRSLAVR
ncbi:MAG TPA: hypothetical protein VKJ07_13895, partial [Mycobacteriales bacterium]|nr:hypothetical protein [Mycobacteriales bacterium]